MNDKQLSLNGQRLKVSPGETILENANRHGVEIPTLCHDPRLAPAGACRTCLVEVEGSRRLVAACATPARADMVIRTDSPRVLRHQKALVALYMTDHPGDLSDCETGAACQLHRMADAVGAPTDWPRIEASSRGSGRPQCLHRVSPRLVHLVRSLHPLLRRSGGVSAIALANRGSETTISPQIRCRCSIQLANFVEAASPYAPPER